MQLNVRVVGCITFGGPLPTQALTCLDDVSTKGAAASITHLEKCLDNQFLVLDPSNVAPLLDSHVPGKPLVQELTTDQAVALSAQFTQDAPQHQNGSSNDGVPPPHASPPASVGGFPRAKRVPFYWPEHLHLTFDNTAADYKNVRTFNFLAMLVALCVFNVITISTMIVGHTHDIVDQMFRSASRESPN